MYLVEEAGRLMICYIEQIHMIHVAMGIMLVTNIYNDNLKVLVVSPHYGAGERLLVYYIGDCYLSR